MFGRTDDPRPTWVGCGRFAVAVWMDRDIAVLRTVTFQLCQDLCEKKSQQKFRPFFEHLAEKAKCAQYLEKHS